MKHRPVKPLVLSLILLSQIVTGCTDEMVGMKNPLVDTPTQDTPALAPVETPALIAEPGSAPSPIVHIEPEPTPQNEMPASDIVSDGQPVEVPAEVAVPSSAPDFATPAVPATIVGTTPPSIVPEDSDVDGEQVPVAETEESPYMFDPKTNSCKNDEGLIGLNVGLITICTDQSGRKISDQNLSGSDLSGINLSGSIIENTNLTGVNLTGADVTDAKLDNVVVDGIKITNTDFDNSIIENSDLKDFETIDELVENGLEIGINNRLPTLVSEIEAVVNSEITLESKNTLPIDEFIDGRNISSEDPTSEIGSALGEEAAHLKEEIKKKRNIIDENRRIIKSARSDIKNIKDQKKEKHAAIKGIKDTVIADKKDLKKLLQEKKELSAKLRDLKDKYKQANSKNSEKIKNEIKKVDQDRKKIVSAIRELRKDRSRIIASIKSTQKEIDAILDSVSDKRDLLKKIRVENQSTRRSIEVAIKRYKEIRKKLRSV